MDRILGTIGLAAFVAAAVQPATAQTLDVIRDRGKLICGINPDLPGFAARDQEGAWRGFDVDFCRAVAAAIFNDAGKVEFKALSNAERLTALKNSDIDLLSRNTTWTMARETALGINFAAVTYYDGQGFLVRSSLKAESALELGGKSICVQTGTTTEANLADYFRGKKLTYQLNAFPSADEALAAYNDGRCDAFTTDTSALFAERLKLAKPDEHVILPDIISKEPLSPAVRQGDDRWFKIVQWTHFVMLNAEELGVTSKTIEQAMNSDNPEIRRLVGLDGSAGTDIGLSSDWAARIIRLVGNYDEVFERNVGTGSKLGIPRGINQLWTHGGIQYAPPIR
ncbi:MAG: amino acid ABC transporter substrate-binding protein [Xanthobacteraceae bacterium]